MEASILLIKTSWPSGLNLFSFLENGLCPRSFTIDALCPIPIAIGRRAMGGVCELNKAAVFKNHS